MLLPVLGCSSIKRSSLVHLMEVSVQWRMAWWSHASYTMVGKMHGDFSERCVTKLGVKLDWILKSFGPLALLKSGLAKVIH